MIGKKNIKTSFFNKNSNEKAKIYIILIGANTLFHFLSLAFVAQNLLHNASEKLIKIFKMAFSMKSVAGGVGGTIVVSMTQALRWGVARGVFSNEAGLGSAAITAAAATTDNPVRQGYINMTGTFFDTIVICTITGLAIASSGVLGSVDKAGEIITGSALTIKAFSTVLGNLGGTVVSIGITLFAFSTIIGWEYHGEKAFEYIFKKPKYNIIYRVVFSLIAYIGATTTLEVVWSFSDVMNGLMAIPNLISLLALSGVIAKDVKEFQKIIEKEKAEKKEEKSLKNEIA